MKLPSLEKLSSKSVYSASSASSTEVETINETTRLTLLDVK